MISTMRENKGKKELFTFGSGILLVILLVHLLGLILCPHGTGVGTFFSALLLCYLLDIGLRLR